jgi:hypothetical protein
MKAVWVMKAAKSGLSLGINKKDRDRRINNGEKGRRETKKISPSRMTTIYTL